MTQNPDGPRNRPVLRYRRTVTNWQLHLGRRLPLGAPILYSCVECSGAGGQLGDWRLEVQIRLVRRPILFLKVMHVRLARIVPKRVRGALV